MMSSLFVPIIVGQLLTHDGPIIRFFGISLPEIALEGRGNSWLGGVIKSFGIGSLLPSPNLLLFFPPPAFANGNRIKLEERNSIKMISILSMPIGLMVIKDFFLVEQGNFM